MTNRLRSRMVRQVDLGRVAKVAHLDRTPPGVIMIWNNKPSEIPNGWRLCNGQNGTPDLRGRGLTKRAQDSEITTQFIMRV